MTNSEFSDEDDFGPATDGARSSFEASLQALEIRCKNANLAFSSHTFAIFDDDDDDKYAIVEIPAGRNKRNVMVSSVDKADELLSVEFEDFRFLSGYDAIYRVSAGYIEAALTSHRVPAHSVVRRIKGLPFDTKPDEVGPIEISPPHGAEGRPHIEIGPISAELSAFIDNRGRRFSIKLIGARAKQQDAAIRELRAYADSILFQLDSLYSTPLFLDRETRRQSRAARNRPEPNSLTYPTTHYNEDAMSLYWYAKVARDMPLLRYLAFYQSIEFYFPRYSQSEARRRVSSIVKDPSFRPHRDDDLDRIISAIKIGRGGGVGNERSQLRAVVAECIGADEARAYLIENPERLEHFSGKGGKKRYHSIPILNKTADLRGDIADRIYDIRCKIVHTKNDHSDDDDFMILPFSDDAEYLIHDIDLVEFVAQQVLISSGDELS